MRASRPKGFLKPKDVDDVRIGKARELNKLAQHRGQSLAQMALAWVLRSNACTSALIGTSTVDQVDQDVATIANLSFSDSSCKKLKLFSPD